MAPHVGGGSDGGATASDAVELSSSSVSEGGGGDAEAEVKSRADTSVKKKRKKTGGGGDLDEGRHGAAVQVKRVASGEGRRGKELEKRKKKQNKERREEEEGIRRGEESSASSVSSSSFVLGPCSFPMSRVKRLVRSEGGNGGATAVTRTTHDAVFLINKAAEMFLKLFTKDAYASAMKEHRTSVTFEHLSSTVSNGKRYEFLSDFIPEEVRAEDALKAAKAMAGL